MPKTKMQVPTGGLKLGSLQQFEAAEDAGVWVGIIHPASPNTPFYMGGQSEKPLRIKTAGSYSRRYREAEAAARRETLQLRRPLSDAEREARELGILAACALEWEGAFDDDGTPIPFSKENVQTLYAAAYFIALQMDAAIGDHARFFGASSQS